MCDFDLQIDFDIKGLSLIDVTSEDDCLIDSPLRDDISPQFSGFSIDFYYCYLLSFALVVAWDI